MLKKLTFEKITNVALQITEICLSWSTNITKIESELIIKQKNKST